MIFKSIGKILKKFLPIQHKLHIYTDGSHKEKWGSWAFVVVRNNKIFFESSGRVRKTNSHRMEFQAAIEALSYLKKGDSACLYSDSKVLVHCFIPPFERPVVNGDQIEQLDALILDRNITWKWVKAHSGMVYNERCDELCILARNPKY